MEVEDNIISKAKNGDKEAFKGIVEAYKDIVFAICFNVLRNHHDAENASQETFIKIYSSLKQYENRGFKTWLSRIAMNKAIDMDRERKRKSSLDTISLEENPEVNISDYKTTEDLFFKGEDKKRLNKICKQLPSTYRNVIHKYYINSESYEQIAKEEGISIRTVESRLYRGKKLIKDLWEVGS